ncbi:MAG: cytochrome c [Acidobacteria bacterium]|nr:cytochrome c [Acidobacteriota bacterium]
MNSFLTSPTFKFLQVVPYLVYLMLFFHLPYMGMALGTTTLSIIYHKWKPAVSKDLISLFSKTQTWFFFGLLPVVILAFLYKMLLFNTPIPIHIYLLGILGLQGLAFIILIVYRFKGYTFAGLAAVLLMAVYCFYFIDISSLIIFPEKWFFLNRPFPYPFFSITPLIDFLDFLCLSLIITGAAILFFYFQWPGKSLPGTLSYYNILKYNSYVFILAGSLLMPLVILWDLLTLPGFALSAWIFILSGLMIPILAAEAYAVVNLIMHKDRSLQLLPYYSAGIFMVSLVLFGLWIAKDLRLQTTANLETTAALSYDALKAQSQIFAKREDQFSKSVAGDEKLGEQVYNEKCSACHGFDQVVLGPPLNNVLPKYFNQQAELYAFIKNPQKIDPQYPAMPDQGLNTLQIKSVIKFLMVKMGVKDESKDENKGENKNEMQEMSNENKNK